MQSGDYPDTALAFAGILTIAVTALILDAALRPAPAGRAGPPWL